MDGGVYKAGERKRRGCYVMRGDRSDEESQRRSGRVSVWGGGEASGPQSLYGSRFGLLQ